MKVSKSDVVALLVACGLKNAGTFDLKKLGDKLGGLDEDKVKKIKDKNLKNLGNALLKAIEDEKDVVITDDAKSKKAKAKAEEVEEEEEADDEEEDAEESEDEEESEEEESEDDSDDEESEDEEGEEDAEEEEEVEEEDEDEKPKKKKGEKEEKPKKKAKSTVAKDYLGNRVGTRTSRINLAISDKPKTAAKIAEDAKALAIHSHLSKLKENGWIEKTKEGFKLTKKGSAARAKHKAAKSK